MAGKTIHVGLKKNGKGIKLKTISVHHTVTTNIRYCTSVAHIQMPFSLSRWKLLALFSIQVFSLFAAAAAAAHVSGPSCRQIRKEGRKSPVRIIAGGQ